jgi:thymidine kinase
LRGWSEHTCGVRLEACGCKALATWRLSTTLSPDPCILEPALPPPIRPGWIEVIAGVMFSGKSEELIRRVRRAVIARRRVQVFKSHLDARYTGLYSVSSHDGGTVEAEPVDSSDEIMRRWRPETEVAAVDEVQFLDDGISAVASRLADQGVRVVLAGIDTDFRGLPFGPMPTLLAIAEIVDKLQAICVVCGGPASRNQRLVNGRPALWDSPTIMVGGREKYEARCRHCHRVPRVDEDQTALL